MTSVTNHWIQAQSVKVTSVFAKNKQVTCVFAKNRQVTSVFAKNNHIHHGDQKFTDDL